MVSCTVERVKEDCGRVIDEVQKEKSIEMTRDQIQGRQESKDRKKVLGPRALKAADYSLKRPPPLGLD